MPSPVSRRTLLAFLAAAGAASPARGWAADSAEGPGEGAVVADSRVDSLVSRLTLDEKLGLLHGAPDPEPLGQAGYLPGVPRLGIPPLRLADGPAGVRVSATATALPAPVLLASAFDPDLARRYGQVIGREGRALGQDVLLSPMVNLLRTPYGGRNFETFTEDPLLAADLVAAEIEGIQGEGLIATVKHFALNNQEADRENVDVRVDEQTLYEVESRGFEAAVAARVGCVMGAYNKVDGTYACENERLLTGLLRDRWGFTGWVMTDWNAAHSTAASLRAGLDMEMPDGAHFGAALKAAVTSGEVPEAYVDRAVRRILAVRERFGHFDAAVRPARDAAAGAAVALEVAKAGATLLRNVNGTLPLRAGSVAVIGASADYPFVSGGGSAHVVSAGAQSPLAAIRRRMGEVTYALGEDLFGKDLALGESGVFTGEGEHTFVLHFTGSPVERPKVLLDGEELFPLAPGWSEYFVGGLTTTAPDGMTVRRATRHLAPGEHTLKITGGQRFHLRHITEATRARDVAEAVAAARAADQVVLFAYEDATESLDRTTLALPGNQERLIEAVTEANPRTTVVLNTSSATAMPWLERTGAVLQMYYPGQEGAAATAAVLAGDCDPGGRLTQSFPVDDTHHPVAGDARRYPGADGVVEYSEGVHTGYRWYDAQGVRPLFPFGHGLSYTSFAYSDLAVNADGQGIGVEFTVVNTGGRDGVDVPQVYVGPSPDVTVPQAVRVLAGYRRVALRAGERRRVRVEVAARTLSSWDPGRGAWVLGTGARTVWVGASVGELRLRARVEV
ncbi:MULTISPECIES: glycoside hydrolase family 3 protein [unclassified Streptomyces]|uniref:beta-glucosidase n=1 Tax=unclassified Streptomyces TaxID=2593676 RepID=UPI000DD99F15|nr:MULTISPECIES: glycoside hydrolase family 3 protein [unclassified Streptomyces]QZZ26483.1 beta-glucosidase [Streptomyces sp. ST1015]